MFMSGFEPNNAEHALVALFQDMFKLGVTAPKPLRWDSTPPRGVGRPWAATTARETGEQHVAGLGRQSSSSWL